MTAWTSMYEYSSEIRAGGITYKYENHAQGIKSKELTLHFTDSWNEVVASGKSDRCIGACQLKIGGLWLLPTPPIPSTYTRGLTCLLPGNAGQSGLLFKLYSKHGFNFISPGNHTVVMQTGHGQASPWVFFPSPEHFGRYFDDCSFH